MNIIDIAIEEGATLTFTSADEGQRIHLEPIFDEDEDEDTGIEVSLLDDEDDQSISVNMSFDGTGSEVTLRDAFGRGEFSVSFYDNELYKFASLLMKAIEYKRRRKDERRTK